MVASTTASRATAMTAAQYRARMKEFVSTYKPDLGQPWGFSVYLLGAYGPDADPSFIREIRQARPSAFGGYPSYVKAALGPVAPRGLWAWRGLHSLDLSDGADLNAVWDRRDRSSGANHYSMNAGYVVQGFVLSRGRRTLRGDSLLIASKATPSNVKSFGGDSESGDTMEAEVYLSSCEPSCVKHVFALSKHKIGPAVSKELRAMHALDEHFEVRVVDIAEREERSVTDKHDPTLYLHPLTPAKLLRGMRGLKRVKHTIPSGYSWQVVQVTSRTKLVANPIIPKSCSISAGSALGNISVACKSAEDALKLRRDFRRRGWI